MHEDNDSDLACATGFDELLDQLRESRPNDRSPKDRAYAVSITMLEQAWAFFEKFVIRGGK